MMTRTEKYLQRERIATAAMSAILSRRSEDIAQSAILSRRSVGGTYEDIAQSAMKYTDALIKELNKEV